MSGADIRTASLAEQLAGLVAQDADAVALAQALDPEVQEIADLAETCAFLSRVPDLDSDQCDKVAAWFKLVQLEAWGLADLDRKRAVLADIVDIYRRRGTRWALERILGVLESGLTEWDGDGTEWDGGGTVWDDLTGMFSVEEWWERTPNDPPYTYRVDALIEHYGLSVADIARIMEVLDAYVPVRARLLELSETLVRESTLHHAGYPEVGLWIEVTA